MPIAQHDRSSRIERFVDDMSVEELRRTTLQAVDHAYKSAAEVAEAQAICQGALGRIAQLKDENQRLRDRVKTLEHQYGLLVSSQAWKAAQRAARQARGVRRRLTP